MTVDREKLLAAFPIRKFLSDRGVECVTSGPQLKCKCPFHADKDPSMSVNEQKGLWHCFVCDIGGTIIDLSVRLDGVSVNVAINDLAEKARLKPTDERPRTVARYKYKDRMGRDVMQVERVEAGSKKKFMQSHVDPSGQVVRNIKGVERVLFRLEKWHGKDEVSICEGEKCVAAMESIGIDATCNPGGAGGWLDGYATYLEGKHVDIWPDNDDAGLKWASTLVDSLEGRVASLRVLHVPSIYGDVADMVIAQGKDDALSTIGKIQDGVDRIDKGVVIPLLSASECMELYRKRMTAENDSSLDLSLWLPSFKTSVRPLLPGDMMLVLSDTGVGKTTILSNIAKSQRHLKSIFFEFELSPEPMAERFIAMDVGKTTSDVERRVRGGETFDVSGWDHVFICPESGVDLERMEEIIVRSELKLGEVPRLVLIDYIGLMGGGGSKRYERISNAAEGLKQLARRTDTIIVVASQLGRNRDRIEVELNDAKDSGSVENSAQLVIGAWRPEPDLITLKVLKQTKMTGESEITAEFNGNMQRITEKFGEFSEGAFDNEQTGGSL